MSSSVVLNIGTRNSPLAQTQTAAALEKINALLPSIEFRTILAESPGDRDKVLDLQAAPQDFFTQDLDEMICRGEVDMAIHSAKDLPDEICPELDYFFLPWREDPRDALILPKGQKEVPKKRCIRVGVSSERREAYSRETWEGAELIPIRGNIEERIQQLDDGKFDLIILAVAGLNRLGLSARITRKIPEEELPVAEAQGILAVTFRKGDQRLIKIRNLLLPAVVLAGAGIGSEQNTTFAVHEAMKSCNHCLYDALLPSELLKNLSDQATSLPVGKRAGSHSVKQADICELLVKAAKEGKRVLRLKGGDPSVFGRLAEETDRLEEEQIPFRVLAGNSSYSVAAASSGMLPTRRNISRGFTLLTPRTAGTHTLKMPSEEEKQNFPKVLYMASHAIDQVCQTCLEEGMTPTTPVAIILSAGAADERIFFGSIEKPPVLDQDAKTKKPPGLLLIGENFKPSYQFKKNAPFSGLNILYCGSQKGEAKARQAVEEKGGKFLSYPMINLSPLPEAATIVNQLEAYDYVLITSPASALFFLEACQSRGVDVRKIPEILVCGPGTAAVFQSAGLYPYLCPSQNYGAKGLLEALEGENLKGLKVLRLLSDHAGPMLSEKIREKGADVDEVLFYTNSPIQYDNLPRFDAVLFSSSSAVKGFVQNVLTPLGKEVIACSISPLTAKTVEETRLFSKTIIAPEATLTDMVTSLAADLINKQLRDMA